MSKVGYARVSTTDQDTALQLDALQKAGVSVVFRESGSGVGPRPQLHRAIASLQRGDVLVVWKIDRIARSLSGLLRVLERLEAIGAGLKSLTEPIDTSTPIGEFVVHILGAVAQFERSIIRERVVAGQRAARARGKTWGPKRILCRTEALRVASMWRSGWFEQRLLADMFEMSLSSLRDSIHWVENRGRWANRPSEH